MHLHIILLLPILAIGVFANYRVNGTTHNTESSLIAAPLVPGARVSNDIYEHCKEINEAGETISDGEDCFDNALRYLIQALNDARKVRQEVALLSNTVSGYQSVAFDSSNSISPPTSSSPGAIPTTTGLAAPQLERRSGNAMEAIFAKVNDQIHRRSNDVREPRAVQIGRSEIHPVDGLAVRTNVHSGDATLHVHTNGSHATAAFQAGTSTPLGRRDGSATPESEYRFDGAQGLKVQIKMAEDAAYSELSTLMSVLARGDGEMAPKLKESDSWALALCKKPSEEEATGETMLQGKLVMEDDGAGYDWEDGGLVDCTA